MADLRDEQGRPIVLTDEHGNPMHLTGVATTSTTHVGGGGTAPPPPAADNTEIRTHGGGLTGGQGVNAGAPTGDVKDQTDVLGCDDAGEHRELKQEEEEEEELEGEGEGEGEREIQRSLSSSSSTSLEEEDDGKGGRRKKKKGLKEKIREKLTGSMRKYKDEYPQTTGVSATTTPPTTAPPPLIWE